MDTLRPDGPLTETIARVQIADNSVRVRFPERLDPFNKLVKSLRYYWSSPYWTREIDARSGPLPDRAAELCSRLLEAGYVVEPPDEDVLRMVVSGSYAPEQTRWILARDGYFRVWWARGEDWYTRARNITGSTYDHGVLVPLEHYAEVQDFAALHGFRFSDEARALLRQAERDRASSVLVQPTVYQADAWTRPTLNVSTFDVSAAHLDHRDCDFGVTTALYEHQRAAVERLAPLTVGALFMEMGTGKTRCAIELAWLRRHRVSCVVWFCPVSLKETARAEIAKHTTIPPGEVCVFDGTTDMQSVPRAFWYVVGLESISGSDRVTLTANALIDAHTMVVVDESGYIKGHDSLRTKRVTEMASRARYRLILTGTPLSQGVVDLYAQMRFLSSDILGYRSFYSFAANHLEYSEKHPGMIVRSHNTDWLAARIQPYVYQVTKADCLDLPDKLYDARYFGMTDAQRDLYEQTKMDILMSAPADELDSYTIFRLFNALQQITSGFYHDTESDELVEVDHCRIDALLDVICSLPGDAKVIVWCKFVYSVRQIVTRLEAEFSPDAVSVLYGELNETERTAQIERWRDTGRFLVATQATGGHGLTLVEAHYATFYENGFKYSHRIQAEDRCHRIGQTERVTYIDLVCSRSIDERIQKALSEKQDVVRAFKRSVDKADADHRRQMAEEL